MELLAGQSLRDRLTQRGPMPVADACLVAIQVLSALSAAHRAGIVHRDVKPANVFVVQTPLTDVFVKLLDFGVAKLLTPQPGPALTSFDSVIGSAPYMAPEQILGVTIDGRTDLFALGVTLYEMLAGRRPFIAVGNESVMATILRGGPIAPLAGVPGPLGAVVLRALATSPAERYASAEEMSEALMPFIVRAQLGVIATTATATRAPVSRTDTAVDAPPTRSATWGPPTLAATVDQTRGYLHAATSPPPAFAPPPPPFAQASAHAPRGMPAPARSWTAIVIGAVVGVALLIAAVGFFVLGGPGGAIVPLSTRPSPVSLLPAGAIVGSCKSESSCAEYTRAAAADQPRYCEVDMHGKWQAAPCNRKGADLGCRFSTGITIWSFPPTDKPAFTEACSPSSIAVLLTP